MLQQTQVARVLEKFSPFLERFPTLQALAEAEESRVLAAWSGLGYYRRARLLQAAARAAVQEFKGALPATVEELRRLPGVGRYTAGAIASIVFHKPEPIVDGNVARVLLRLEGKPLPAEAGVRWAWERSGALAGLAGGQIAAFNEGLMELGATVCTPKNPRCLWCPLAHECRAKAQGTQDQIPLPKRRTERALMTCESVIVRNTQGQILLEQRPGTGLWAGLWQVPTLEHRAKALPPPARLARRLNLRSVDPAPLATFTHDLSHRRVMFRIWQGSVDLEQDSGRIWRSLGDLKDLGISNAQRRVLETLAKNPA